ncbi:type 2 periplasmic-binding domain-containing protein [Gulosibacter molinativorax]|uniref:hypothetical protein n=1 Tax=Gulosibacter molinativorax TaxID=256821 RepID=UPI000415AE4C|nr:hypothetical protein [Gulosibacter molinativorax]QUY61930.1 LysR family transcriptional regulator [Gulosibacter molinativorax]
MGRTFVDSTDVDSWLDAIAAGQGIGITASATAYHHPRPGIFYRPLRDCPPLQVRLAWWRDSRPVGVSDLVAEVTALYAGG